MRSNLIKVLTMFTMVPSVFAIELGGIQNQMAEMIQTFLALVAMVPYGATGMTQEGVASVGLLKIASIVIWYVLFKELMNRVPVFENFEEKSKTILLWTLPIVISLLTPNAWLEDLAAPIGQILFVGMSFSILALVGYISIKMLKNAGVFQ